MNLKLIQAPMQIGFKAWETKLAGDNVEITVSSEDMEVSRNTAFEIVRLFNARDLPKIVPPAEPVIESPKEPTFRRGSRRVSGPLEPIEGE